MKVTPVFPVHNVINRLRGQKIKIRRCCLKLDGKACTNRQRQAMKLQDSLCHNCPNKKQTRKQGGFYL